MSRARRTGTYTVVADDRWMHRATCVDRLDLPWTTDTADLPVGAPAAMATVCAECPVRDACAGFVVAAGITGGTWAGLDRNPNLRIPVQDPLPGLGDVA